MSLHEQADVPGHDLQRHHPPAVLAGLRPDPLRTKAPDLASHDWAAIPWAPHHLIPESENATSRNPRLRGHAGDSTHLLCQTTRLPRHLKPAVPSRGA